MAGSKFAESLRDCLLPLYSVTARDSHPTGEKKTVGGEGTVRLSVLRDNRRNANPWDITSNYWLATIFAIHGRPFPWGPIVSYILYTTLVAASIILKMPNYSDSATLKGVQFPVQTIGLALFLLISFRTQTAYDRWWEGRKSWGAITANCMDLARQSAAYVPDLVLGTRMITWTSVYAITFRYNLQYLVDINQMPEVTDLLSLGELRKMQKQSSLHLYALHQATITLAAICAQKKGPNASVFTEMEKRLGRIGSEQCVCTRIRNTPMPAGYVIHLRSFLVLWLIILPFAFIAALGWYSVPLCIVVGYELLGYEEVGAEIENPFTSSYHALPLEGVVAGILSNASFFLRAIQERGTEAATPTSDESKRRDGPPKPPTDKGSVVASAHILTSQSDIRALAKLKQESNRLAVFDRLGGQAVVLDAVEIFYKRLLADPQLAPFFGGISIERLKAKQVKFLTYALGGADDYVGKDPAITHRRLHNEKGLRVEHFHAVIGHLQATLQELGVTDALIQECLAALAPMEKTFGCSGQECIGH